MSDASSSAGRRFVDEFSAWLTPEDPAGPGNQTYFETATIVVDTNVLLDLYRVSSATRQEILYVLKRIRGRLWIPHQVALEYSRNRREAVIGRNKQFSTVKDLLRNSENRSIESLQNALEKFLEFRDKNRSGRSWDPAEYGVDKAGISNKIKGIWREALAELDELEREIDLSMEDLAADPILGQLNELLTGRTGSAPSAEELQIYVEHAVNFRYPNKIPPGFEDLDEKETPLRQAGDYLLWRQLINHLKADGHAGSRRVMLVTGDLKCDWWEMDRAKNPIHARPELVHELRREADSDLLLLSLTQFLQGAKAYLDYEVSDAAISEVKEQEEMDQIKALLPDIVRNSHDPVDLLELNPKAFERVIMYLLVAMGWEVEKHFLDAPAPVDFIAVDKEGRRVAVEVKRYRTRGSYRKLKDAILRLEYHAYHMEVVEPFDKGMLRPCLTWM